MTNRITTIFERKREAGEKALMPFLTAGDPGLSALPGMLAAMEAAGASVVEVGLPFSDPIADGPVIQASMKHALDLGATIDDIFAQIKAVRPKVSLGLVAMVSYSIVHRRGLTTFIQQAKDAGFDGFIFPDLPLEESSAAQQACAEAGMILSMLIAPATPIERAKAIAKASTGFVYVVSRAGITGEQKALPSDLGDRLTALRTVTDLPLTVGFGISNAEQVGQVVELADAAIVGSALVRRLADYRATEGEDGKDGEDADEAGAVKEAATFTAELAKGLG